MKEKYHYQKQWEEYRRRRNRQYIVGIAGMLLPGAIFLVLRKSGMESNKAMVLLSFLSILATIIVVAVILHFHKWMCPNCGKRFFVKSFWVRFPEFSPDCTNCHLPKYAGSTFEQNYKLNNGEKSI